MVKIGHNGCYDKPEYKAKQRVKKLGAMNGMYRGGHSRKTYLYHPLLKSLKQECCMCGTTKKLIAHHIDENYQNNVLSNLAIVCRGCHNTIHKTK